MSDLHSFREAIEEFISIREMNPTRFGKEYANDPGFVFQLRNGREPREATRAKVLEAMRSQAAASDRGRA